MKPMRFLNESRIRAFRRAKNRVLQLADVGYRGVDRPIPSGNESRA